ISPVWSRDQGAWELAWRRLEAHAGEVRGLDLRAAFRRDPGRFERFSLALPLAGTELLADYSKHLITSDTLPLLVALARAAGLEQAREAMFAGERINVTEDRPALHVALRDLTSERVLADGVDVLPEVRAVRERMRDFTRAVHAGDW